MHPYLAVVLAVSAALVFGIASVADQRSTKRVKRRGPLSPRIFLDLARQPLWLASICGTLLGFALQVLALRYGPLALVEPLLVCGLIFAVLINSYLRRSLDAVLIGGVIAAAAGVAGFLAIARPTNGQSSVGFLVVLPLAAGLTVLVAGCLAVAKRSDFLRPLALALACGINYGLAASSGRVRSWSPMSCGAVCLRYSRTGRSTRAGRVVGPLGFLFNENAFQQGTLIAPVLAIITSCDPIISIALAALFLNEKLSGTPKLYIMPHEVISLTIMVVGVVVTAHRAPHVAAQLSNASSPDRPNALGDHVAARAECQCHSPLSGEQVSERGAPGMPAEPASLKGFWPAAAQDVAASGSHPGASQA